MCPLGDVIIHEQDLRGALGVAGGRDSGGIAAIRGDVGPYLDAFALLGSLPEADLNE